MAISYIEMPNMRHNPQAVLEIIKFIYDNIMYAELNTKLDYCQECGWNGEIKLQRNEKGIFEWKCPQCGNKNQDTMDITRRTCGYLGAHYWNQGRTNEIFDRELHI